MDSIQSYNSCHGYGNILTYCKKTIVEVGRVLQTCAYRVAFLWEHCRNGPIFTPSEKSAIKQLGERLKNKPVKDSPHLEALFGRMLNSPKKSNGIFVKALDLYAKETLAFGNHDASFQCGLEALKDLSYSLANIGGPKDFEKLYTKTIHISKLCLKSDGIVLAEADKLTLHEVYTLYLALKAHGIYQKIKDASCAEKLQKDFDDKSDFYSACRQIIGKAWDTFEVNNLRTLSFVSEERSRQAIHGQPKHFAFLRRFLRRGDALHISLLDKTQPTLPAFQIHVTHVKYERSGLRFIELLTNNFLSIDLKKLISSGDMHRLANMWGIKAQDNKALDDILNKKWDMIMSEVLKNPAFDTVKNSTSRKLLCVLKWLGLARITRLSKNSQNKICSEFVVDLIRETLDTLNKQLKEEHRKKTNTDWGQTEPFKDPFDNIPSCCMTPGDVFHTIKKHTPHVHPGSHFLDAIIKK